MKKLIEQIQDRNIAVSDLLRNAKIIAIKLNQEKILKWINLELDGYGEDNHDYPPYRKLSGKAKFYNPYYQSWLPVVITNPDQEKILLNMCTNQGIEQIEELLKSEAQEYLMPYSVSVAKIILEGSPFQTEVALVVGRPSLIGILNKVRNLLLDWAIENQDESQNKKTEINNDSLEDLIKKGENFSLEFKSSLRWNYRNNQPDTELEYVIAKTISAFLNSDGGKLLIGVDDKGSVLGLEKDYSTLKENNFDKFSLKLVETVNNYLGVKYNKFIKIDKANFENKEVCIITMSKSDWPVYVKKDGKEEFFIRASASSHPLGIKEASEYIKSHWK